MIALAHLAALGYDIRAMTRASVPAFVALLLTLVLAGCPKPRDEGPTDDGAQETTSQGASPEDEPAPKPEV